MTKSEIKERFIIAICAMGMGGFVSLAGLIVISNGDIKIGPLIMLIVLGPVPLVFGIKEFFDWYPKYQKLHESNDSDEKQYKPIKKNV